MRNGNFGFNFVGGCRLIHGGRLFDARHAQIGRGPASRRTGLRGDWHECHQRGFGRPSSKASCPGWADNKAADTSWAGRSAPPLGEMQCDTTTSFDGFLEGTKLMMHVASKQKPSRTGQLHSKRPSAAAAACLWKPFSILFGNTILWHLMGYDMIWHITLYYLILYCIILYYITLYYFMLYIILYCILLYYIVLYYIILHFIILHYVILYFIIIYYIVLYYIMIYIFYFVVLYCNILYYFILYYFLLYYIYYRIFYLVYFIYFICYYYILLFFYCSICYFILLYLYYIIFYLILLYHFKLFLI